MFKLFIVPVSLFLASCQTNTPQFKNHSLSSTIGLKTVIANVETTYSLKNIDNFIVEICFKQQESEEQCGVVDSHNILVRNNHFGKVVLSIPSGEVAITSVYYRSGAYGKKNYALFRGSAFKIPEDSDENTVFNIGNIHIDFNYKGEFKNRVTIDHTGYSTDIEEYYRTLNPTPKLNFQKLQWSEFEPVVYKARSG